MAGLLIDGVSRTFSGLRGRPATRALEPTSLIVDDHDFLVLLGPSGCGKSTLLRIVAGLDQPTTGRVLVNGAPVRGPGADRGMVFQSYTLFPWLTVEQNIRFGLREKGMAEVEQARVAAHYIARVGLGGFERHYPRTLSGGMQQRTALARALANDPKILLLDEPFGALDNQTRALMQELLLGIWEADRKTVLFVTHDIDEAIFMANRVAVLTARPGRIKTELAIDAAPPAALHPQDHRRVFRLQGAPDRGDPRGIDPRRADGRLDFAGKPAARGVNPPSGPTSRGGGVEIREQSPGRIVRAPAPGDGAGDEVRDADDLVLGDDDAGDPRADRDETGQERDGETDDHRDQGCHHRRRSCQERPGQSNLGVARPRADSSAAVSSGYSITWSARRISACGIVRPSALAVLRLMTRSSLVGCSMGRSAGLAPLRILST